jgi:hypothetical protein
VLYLSILTAMICDDDKQKHRWGSWRVRSRQCWRARKRSIGKSQKSGNPQTAKSESSCDHNPQSTDLLFTPTCHQQPRTHGTSIHHPELLHALFYPLIVSFFANMKTGLSILSIERKKHVESTSMFSFFYFPSALFHICLCVCVFFNLV